MNSIKVLDVTLRDGGCVNNFDFGTDYIEKILLSLEQSGVDIIELGYIDEKNGTARGRTQYCNEEVIREQVLKHKKPDALYVSMIDYGKFNIDSLKIRSEAGIDGIRMAFHKDERFDLADIGRKIIDKGYQLFIQPMITMRYSDKELLELIAMVNEKLPEAAGFYIVDSFGEMRANDVIRVFNLVDHNLLPSMTLGYHSHNNLQLSYSNAMTILQFPTNRNLILDASLMGMGKGAGNLNTELLLEHLNLYHQKKYNVAPLLAVIDQVINQIHKEYYWGYAVEYYLSSIYHCTPSYAGHFYNKHMLPVDRVAELLALIKDDKKISFDKEYAEQIYRQYNAGKTCEDDGAVEALKEKLADRTVLLIAPGKSILEAAPQIRRMANRDDVVSINLNHFYFETDFVLTTRTEAYEYALGSRTNIIVPSNIAGTENTPANIIDYKKWIVVEEGTYDSSGVMIMNLLEAAGVKHVILAGFDGFSSNINDNYFDKALRHPVTEEQSNQRNEFYREFIDKKRKSFKVDFLTDSKYTEDRVLYV